MFNKQPLKEARQYNMSTGTAGHKISMMINN